MWMNLVVRIALMPLVAGLSYEVIRYAAKKESSAIFQIDDSARTLAAKYYDTGTGRRTTRSCHRVIKRIAEIRADGHGQSSGDG